ncbi:hypothetical protein Fmac_002542 [Flemingia macrophylla]|uniref:Uncharacterized protein n=1 Tax=Flemingia macrophylla TaxID=520843 RepID=A0ABD1NLK7_9FABA
MRGHRCFAREKLQELSEQKAIKEFTDTVSGVLNDEVLVNGQLLGFESYDAISCTFVDGLRGTFDVDIEDLETSRADPFAPFSAKIIEGINQSEATPRALMLFCFVHKDAAKKLAVLRRITLVATSGKNSGP